MDNVHILHNLKEIQTTGILINILTSVPNTKYAGADSQPKSKAGAEPKPKSKLRSSKVILKSKSLISTYFFVMTIK